jgi:hypothetical protein
VKAESSALGEKAKALEVFNQALPLDRAVGNRDGEATTHNNRNVAFEFELHFEGCVLYY